MNATKELVKLLDKRGIEYEQSYIEGIAEYAHVTKWKTQTGSKCTFYEIEDGQPPYFTRMFIELPTPEQAVEATVGMDTCQMELMGYEPCTSIRPVRCSVCGFMTYAQLPSFCPHCGRRVVES